MPKINFYKMSEERREKPISEEKIADASIREKSKKDYIKEKEIREIYKKTPDREVPPSSVVEPEIRNLSPTYIYSTDQSVESFGDVSFDPIATTRSSLAPPSNFQPQPSSVHPDESWIRFCKKNPHHKECLKRTIEGGTCEKNPNDPRCHDEYNAYKELGFFAEEVKDIFDPVRRSDANRTKKPIKTLYESKRDDSQLKVGKVVRTECKCKDGRVVLGYLDTRTGQKDCSPCQKTSFSNPSIYKNYQTKAKPNFENKQVPLRKQVGVSHFGDVNMKGCQTGNAAQSLERSNQMSTLNKVVNVDTIDSVGGATVTTTENTHGLPISLYDGDPTNVYGI